MSKPPLKAAARRLARPFTRPLDGRVADINRRVTDAHRSIATVQERLDVLAGELGAYATTASESNSYVGVEMRRFEESLETLRAQIEESEGRTVAQVEALIGMVDAIGEEGYAERLDRAVEVPLERLDGRVANLVNRANGHRGFAAQAGLWFNPPVTVELREGSAHIGVVNERIVELPYALGTLARLPPPARILDIGSAESTFALSLASLGHEVTALDLHPIPYSHPNLESVAVRFEDWDPGSKRFDAAFAISTLEHFGLGAYGDPIGQHDADRAAVSRVGELLSDDGFLVITTPFGPARVDALERVYDDAALAALLEGWTVLERRTIVRRDERTWMPRDETRDLSEDSMEGVAMVVAAPARQG